MHCLIIDDNAKTSATLSTMLHAIPGMVVHKAVQPYMIRSLIASDEIDIEIIFIRVRLWDYRQFAKLEKMPVVVFLSGGKDKLTNQPGTSVHYTLREPYHPIMVSALFKAIDAERFTEAPEYLFLRYKGRFHKTMFADIEMIERMEKNYTKFFFSNDTQFLPGSISGWMDKLPEDRFIRISDTLIVPANEAFKVKSNVYVYKERAITLTYRFANAAKNEMAQWPEGL